MTSLRQVLIALGDPLVEVRAAPRGLEPDVREVVILEPEDSPELGPGDLALVIGARGRAAAPLIRAAGKRGATAVAVKIDSDAPDTSIEPLRAAAADTGVALLAVRPEVRWEQFEALVRGVLDTGRVAADADTGEVLGDLFALAQTIAALTGGIVSIEDTASRVLAYSRSSDEVDELRRLSILGRQGPEPYLAKLREWGVYQRLRATEEVVRIDEHPELGIRPRLAIGVHAGGRPLGSIWVQRGDTPLTDRAEHALLGAARVTALHLVRRAHETGAGERFRENLLAALLDGRADPAEVARQVGADPAKPVAVVAFAAHGAADPADRTELELRRTELAAVISVHAAAYRRAALVTQFGDRSYALLPDLPAAAEPALLGLTRELVAVAARHLGVRVRAAVGRVSTVDDVRASRQEADRVLDALAGSTDLDVASLAEVRPRVLLGELLTLLAERPRLRDPGLTALRAHDAEHGGDLAVTLLAYLDALGDVRAAATGLHVHPNTLRYRLRRIAEVTGLDLADPLVRLFAGLQLRLPGER
ncbi:MAG TPA: helix-turn-helix domain-containing protein [Pseudonocardiaceae bacterium]|nr:helix-turn-helix domain-containing protein [Pseudonocardiaceae bacterium]